MSRVDIWGQREQEVNNGQTLWVNKAGKIACS